MYTGSMNTNNEVVLKPKGKLFRSKPQLSIVVAAPFLAVIAIYSSGRDTFFLLSAATAGIIVFLLISAWLWFGRTVTLGEQYVKVRSGPWRVYTFTPGTEMNALRVRGASPVLFLKQVDQKAMLNTLNNEQIELVIKRLGITPEEATIATNGLIDTNKISDVNRSTLPFWIQHPITVGIVFSFIMIALVVAGVIAYITLLE